MSYGVKIHRLEKFTLGQTKNDPSSVNIMQKISGEEYVSYLERSVCPPQLQHTCTSQSQP
jgi:hypothetical protein